MTSDPRSLGTLTPDDFGRIREVFEAALERPAVDRPAFIEQVCGGNTLLVAEVNRMLEADARDDRLLNRGDRSRPTACPSCHAALNADDRFCRRCGTPAHGGGSDEGRFRAGALFANRFRIVARLGRGGMGEVYRADDLEVGQPVALKFLTAFRSDERARARLRSEVRLARQISHPNVCRVYDIGESQGELYLSMEYVDGEDLAALLTRIGRLPIDKGIEIARKLCAGLAAAHAKGVLHRDFKPANIMVDSRGEVRIMDFGLAAIASELDASEVRSGTPAYMAPEELAGKEATKQSDLYALGLVLYELFTGKAAFDAKDVEQLLRLRQEHPSRTPSTLIPDITPRLERAILKCLEPDPRLRPASALDVSASLPGGDALADALAAGETPSPQMVADSGSNEGLRPRVAVALLVCALVSLATVLVVTPRVMLLGMLPLRHPPDELAIRARDIVHNLGQAGFVADSDVAFRYDDTYPRYLAALLPGKSLAARQQWNAVLGAAPWPLYFSYRQSAVPLLRIPPTPTSDRATFVPALSNTGLTEIDVDLDGRLLRFTSTPFAAENLASPSAIDWTAAFHAAGLEMDQFTPIQSTTQSGSGHSSLAWTGTYPEPNRLPVRIEAASQGGRPTQFAVHFPWSEQSRSVAAPDWSGRLTVALFVIYVAQALMARHQWKHGRVDFRGAWRVGLYAFAVVSATTLLTVRGLSPNGPAFAVPFAAAASFATAYLGVEPWARKLWPHVMVTWARVIAGRWRDPLVGRDILVALAAVTLDYALQRLLQLSLGVIGAPGSLAGGLSLDALLGGRLMAAAMLGPLLFGLAVSVTFFSVLFVARLVFRRTWLAAIIYFVFWGAMFGAGSALRGDWIALAEWLIEVSFLLFMTLRFGLFAAAVFSSLSMLIDWSIWTFDFGGWYGQSSLVAVVVLVGLGVWAFRTSLGGRPLFAAAP
jgi:serine/threonine protein kinase